MNIRAIKGRSPRVHIPQETWDDFMHLTQLVDKEVGWLTRVERTDDGTFVLYEVHLPPQQSNGATVEFEPHHLAAYAQSLLGTMSPEEFVELNNTLRGWCHSHAGGGVSPSSQDQRTIEAFADDMDWFVAVRTNKAGAAQADVLENGLVFEDVPLTVGVIDDERRAYWAGLVKERVRDIAPRTKGARQWTAGVYGGQQGSLALTPVRDSVQARHTNLKKLSHKARKKVLAEWWRTMKEYQPRLAKDVEAGVEGSAAKLASACYDVLNASERSEVQDLIAFYTYDSLLDLINAGWQPQGGWRTAFKLAKWFTEGQDEAVPDEVEDIRLEVLDS